MSQDKTFESNKSVAPLVTGRIIISKKVPAFSGATAHVILEDASRVDGAATTVAETAISQINHHNTDFNQLKEQPADTVIEFALYSENDLFLVNSKNSYLVRVWIDLDSDGKEGLNDLYSDQAYPVLTHGFTQSATVFLGNT
jgi:hypothetical protein